MAPQLLWQRFRDHLKYFLRIWKNWKPHMFPSVSLANPFDETNEILSQLRIKKTSLLPIQV